MPGVRDPSRWSVVLDGAVHTVSLKSPGARFDIPDVLVDGKPVQQQAVPPYAFAPHREQHFEIAGHKATVYSNLVDLQARAYELVVDGKQIEHQAMPVRRVALTVAQILLGLLLGVGVLVLAVVLARLYG